MNGDTYIIGKSGVNPASVGGGVWGTIDVKGACLIDQGADVNAVHGAVSLRVNREKLPLLAIANQPFG